MVNDEIQLILDEAEDHMKKSIEHLGQELNHIRAGRATPVMLDGIRVEFYGALMPLNQVASVSAPAPDLIVVQPWDRSALQEIERSIKAANLGFNPSNDGSLIRIPVPALSEERRRELVKAVQTRGEETRIAVRNVRRSSKDEIKKVQKEQSLPEDMRYEGESILQGITDKMIQKVDEVLAKKESEIMEV
jgi:ribosome recycling factor